MITHILTIHLHILLYAVRLFTFPIIAIRPQNYWIRSDLSRLDLKLKFIVLNQYITDSALLRKPRGLFFLGGKGHLSAYKQRGAKMRFVCIHILFKVNLIC